MANVVSTRVKQQLTRLDAKRPISPRVHGAIDYGLLTMRLGTGALAWALGAKRVAAGCFINAAIGAGAVLFTDMPGGVIKKLSFRNHVRLDMAHAPLIALTPHMLGLGDSPARLLFYGEALTGAAITLLSDTRGAAPARQTPVKRSRKGRRAQRRLAAEARS